MSAREKPMPGMPWAGVEAVFPFVFAWDEAGRILSIGPSLRRVIPGLALGMQVDEAFRLERPQGTLSPAAPRGILLLLLHPDTGLQLRGQVMHLQEARLEVFLGTPWLQSPEELDRLGLTLADFATHDSAQDLLHVAQVHRIANEELLVLNERLRHKQSRLIEKEAESRKLAMVAERTDNAVILADRQGRIEWVNEAFERMTGWPLAEVRGLKPGAFLQGPRTDLRTAREMGAHVLAGESFRCEILNYRKDRTTYWVDIEVQPIFDPEGQVTHFMAIEADVSGKKRNEMRRQLEAAAAEVITSGVRLPDLIQSMLGALGRQIQATVGNWWVPGVRGDVMHLSESWQRSGAKVEAFMQSSREMSFPSGKGLPGRVWAERTSHWITDVRQDENFPRRHAAAECGITGAVAFPVPVDGHIRGVVELFSVHLDAPDPDLLEALHRIGSQLGLLLKRLEAEAALRRSERAMNEGQRLAHLGTWEWDLRTNALSWSDEKFRIHGFEPRSFSPTLDHVRQCVLPEDLEKLLGTLDAVARTGLSQEVAYRITRPTGEIRHVTTRAAAELDEKGTPCRLVGTMQDMTELIRTEDAYRQAQRIAHLGNWTMDIATGHIRWSDEKYHIYGYEPGSVEVDMDLCRRAIHPDDFDAVMHFVDTVVRTGQPMTTTYRILRPDGEERHLRSSAEVGRGAGGRAREVIGTVLDITELVLAQRTLQQTEERWQFALQNNGLGVWDWNILTGHVLYTDLIQRMLGYELGEWPQHVDSWASRVHPDDLPSVMEAMNKCLSGETPDYICEHRLRCKDSSWKWVQDVGRIVARTKDGKPERMIGTQMDIHMRKQSEEAARRRADMLNGIRAAQEHFIGAVDVAPVFAEMLDVVVSHTRSGFGFVGEVLRDDTGAPYLRSYGLTDIAWNEETRSIMRQMGPMGLEFRNLKTLFGIPMVTGEVLIANDAAHDPRRGGLPPGHPPIHTFLGLPVYNGLEMVGLIGLANRPDGYDEEGVKELDPFLAAVSSMIVARREEQRRRKIEEELRAARDKAEAASRAKSEFLAMISHEIRTPMNGILGMAGLLRAGQLAPPQSEMVEAVLHSGGALMKIIDDILNFAKIEAGQIELQVQPVALDDLVEGVADLLQHEASSKRLELTTHISPALPEVILGDPGRLRQVLLNLAGNAVKFTDTGHVTIRVQPGAAGQVAFLVEDTGIGLPEGAQERLFKPFSQVDGSQSRRFGGTGLGLAISKKLVDAMHGRIGVESRPGPGATFWYEVPLQPGPAPAAPAPGAGSPRLIRIAHASPRQSASIRAALSGPGVEFQPLPRRQLRAHLTAPRHPHEVLLVDAAWMTPALQRLHRASPAPPHLILIGGTAADGGPPAVALPLRRAALRSAVWQLSATPAATPGTAPRHRSLGLRVLVAEDNRVNARLACLLLESFGCAHTVAANGREAVAAFRRQPFDAILMDCQMPIMDGHAATRKIRQAEERLRSTPGRPPRCKIIAMTASALPEERERCLASGMDDYLTKPFEQDTLEALLAGITPEPSAAGPAPTAEAAATSPATTATPATQAPKRAKATTPKATTPKATKPKATTPKATTPKATTPKATTPKATTPIAAAFHRLATQLGHQEARQIAALWLQEAPGRLTRLQHALDHADTAAAAREAHALRGSSTLFGMSAVSENCTTLETASRRSRALPKDCAQKLHTSVQQAIADLRAAL
ncbi:PAS domain-containing protein [Prosthecobacter fluviatilis]|uniref:PAS domain-containing protein n=1 Tax=Prosthecobacter fluviatilis TaxID=445931 RepID=A0ABW0KVM4_9BACT